MSPKTLFSPLVFLTPCFFSSPISSPAVVTQDAPQSWGSRPHLPYLAESLQGFQSCFISTCSHPAVSPLSYLGGSQRFPFPTGTPGWAEPAAARTCWHSHGWPWHRTQRDITRSVSARSLFQRMPWTLHDLAFQIPLVSFSGKVAALAALQREGKAGKEKPEKTCFSTVSFHLPPVCFLSCSAQTSSLSSLPELRPHSKVMLV